MTGNDDNLTVGVCCSGGGIRAASYALGCLQVLEDEGVLRGERRAKYISAVSGGSYAVGAAAVLEYGLEHGSAGGDREMGPFAAGSPELGYLRRHLGYLTHGPGGLSSEVWQAFMGVLMNLVLFASAAAVIGSFFGWFYGWRIKTLRASTTCTTNQSCSTAIRTPSALAWIAIGLGMAAAVVGLLWVLRNWGPRPTDDLRIAALVIAVVAAGFALFVIAMPQLLGWLARSMAPKHADSSGASGIRHPWVTIGGLGGVLVAIRGAISEFKSLGLTDTQSTAGKLLARFRRPLVSLLAMVAVPLFFGGLLLLFMYYEARNPAWIDSSWTGLLYFVVPLAVLVTVDRIGDLNSWSLHTLYKDRLRNAFFLERTSPTTSSTPGFAQGREQPLTLSDLADLHDFPEVLICSTSNLRTYGQTPTGLNAELFLFSANKVGGEGVGDMTAKAYEDDRLVNRLDLTVMDAISISGAAVSPVMGRMTRAPMRLLLALANIRLGVWLPKPNQESNKRPRRPNLEHLLDEAFGDGSSRSRYVYVTDGGHYDNLGLVELLDRKCDWIWCIDASGEQIDSFSTIGTAVAIAQADMGISIDITPEEMGPRPGSRFVQKTFCEGTITYPPDENGDIQRGKLVVVKAGVPKDAPFAVRSYHAVNQAFPCDSTIDQLYTADRFDAYLALGHFSMKQAFDGTDYRQAFDDAGNGHQSTANPQVGTDDDDQPASSPADAT